MKYNTYIFDLDGTLLDTLQDLANSVNYALRQYGLPEHSLDDVRRFVGNGVRLLMERAVPDGAQHPQFETVFATFRQHYMEHSLDTTRPYDGIVETIHELKQRGCRLAVVSNKMMLSPGGGQQQDDGCHPGTRCSLLSGDRGGYWRARGGRHP